MIDENQENIQNNDQEPHKYLVVSSFYKVGKISLSVWHRPTYSVSICLYFVPIQKVYKSIFLIPVVYKIKERIIPKTLKAQNHF
jgi:hypothetical protein